MEMAREIIAPSSKDIVLTKAQVWAMNRGLRVVQETQDALLVQAVVREPQKPEGASPVLWNMQTRIRNAHGNAVTVVVIAAPSGPIDVEEAALAVAPEVLVEELCEFLAGKPAVPARLSSTPQPREPPSST